MNSYIKKFLVIFSVMLLSCSFIALAEADVVGDINTDGVINSEDALAVLKHSAKLINIEADGLFRADVDDNEMVDAADALEILKYAAGIISEFPDKELETTDVPTATPYVEPTAVPEFNGNEVTVKNLNNVATVDKDVICFMTPNKEYDGVEMNNPFTDITVDNGVSISFFFKPSTSYFATDKGYTPLLVFVNENSKEMLKIDAEGTYQYSDDHNRFKINSANFAAIKGNEYFITIVITPEGVKYYVDGYFIKGVGNSGHNENVAYSKLLPLITSADTKMFIGGNDSLYFMASTSRHELSDGSVVRSVTSYNYPLSHKDVSALYCVNTYSDNRDMPEDFSGNVWIIGDSIAAYHEKNASVRPLFGWGELIGEYFTDDIRFYNMGISSQSTSSYYTLRRPAYDYIFSTIKENDYAIISFGHNDHNPGILEEFNRMTAPLDSSDTKYSFKWWLKNYYIDPVLKKGATPILMSAVVRCMYKGYAFNEDYIHLQYGTAMEELVEEYAKNGITVYYIDAQDYTYNLYGSMSQDETKLFHGQYGAESGYFFDNTHYSEAGARMLIDYMLDELKKTDLSIVKYMK